MAKKPPQDQTPPEDVAKDSDYSIPPDHRIRDIEKRWGKSFEHVLADIHDHVFGATTYAHLAQADARDAADTTTLQKEPETTSADAS